MVSRVRRGLCGSCGRTYARYFARAMSKVHVSIDHHQAAWTDGSGTQRVFLCSTCYDRNNIPVKKDGVSRTVRVLASLNLRRSQIRGLSRLFPGIISSEREIFTEREAVRRDFRSSVKMFPPQELDGFMRDANVLIGHFVQEHARQLLKGAKKENVSRVQQEPIGNRVEVKTDVRLSIDGVRLSPGCSVVLGFLSNNPEIHTLVVAVEAAEVAAVDFRADPFDHAGAVWIPHD